MLVKRRLIMAGLMLLVPCLIKADQESGAYDFYLSIDDQKNPCDQTLQYELEKSLFDLQRMSLIYKKVRNASLLYTAIPLAAGLLTVMLGAGRAPYDIVNAAGVFSALLATPLSLTIPAGIFAALAKWLTDEQIEQYEQKLKEHRWKMAYLGQSFTGEQIEQYEQKLKELRLKIETSDDGWTVSNLLFVDQSSS